ncbi:autoinducer binding domain-containing protein [Ruegeria sp. Ofav3-42]|uniref:helix-turn-helix transcriptional regulator n=1 Tax=Ruegeria sp. Ofav3-42 TaxID=2917759 RepID=UPI001EF57657|nr:autoinducer binding domain-containing protein [Ruegeria sp. Ofav3-42]MCG7520868.1 autoinducer binding domain-containing protein [Ruegeria sp. Ofav3-42]
MIQKDMIPDKLLDVASRGMAIGAGDFLGGNLDVFSSYAPEWQAEYFSNNWMAVDPVISTGIRNTGLLDWPELNPRKNSFTGAAHDFGLTQGVVVSQDIGGNRCIAGIACDEPLSDAKRKMIEREVRTLHLDSLALRAEQFSDAQKDLIYLFANGYRGKNVAEIFEVSEDAIKQRKLHIQRHLGVNSFMVVVNICARAGITFHPIS